MRAMILDLHRAGFIRMPRVAIGVLILILAPILTPL